MARTSAQPSTGAGTFEAEAVDAIAAVRDAFARIIELKCPGPKAVTGLCDAFGIHRKLAWQVSKVAYTEDPFAAARHMPSDKSLSAWLEAARAVGVPASLIDAARLAGERFEQIALAHASSRVELDMLLESCGASRDVDADAKWRQQSFVGNSYTWGAHCRVLLAMSVLTPSEDRERFFSIVQVRGLIGYRQTRPGVRWLVNQSVVLDDEARQTTGLVRTALDPRAAVGRDGVPVMPAFCSDPVPELTRRVGADGMVNDEFVSGPVGQTGERTLITGEMVHNIGAVHATEHDKVAHFGTAVRIPAEMLHYDMFVRAGMFGDVERELRVFSDIASPVAFDEADALPVPEGIARLGRGVSLAQTPDVPGYADLAASVFGAIGRDPADYELYRIRMAYPPMPTTVMVRHDLLEPEPGA
ncbi:MAG: hypothetical protein DHS20C14_04240 [Phycisphaeraceae bacterium]|nr:MAG: hypothetical protein DHS20C14_04240 [Phycisphaeraceae bacterium]